MDSINSALFPRGETNNTHYQQNPTYYNLLTEQYKLYLSAAENISQRRQAANNFFITLNSLLISFTGYLSLGSKQSGHLFWLVAIAGLVISFMWYRLVRSYADLNSAKFKVIHELETVLPASPYDAEWEAVGRGQKPELYLPFTRIERWIPAIFAAMHLVVLVASVMKLMP